MKVPSTWKLNLRLIIATALLFALVYVIIALIGTYFGYGRPLTFGIFVLIWTFIQYMIGPKMVEITMGVRYVSEAEAPKLHQMVEDLAARANIPKPRIGISQTNIPNAFAFGKSKKDGRICVTSGILKLLNENELKAVLGHEMSHINHRDMVVMTLISVVPLICYWIYISTLFSDGGRDNGTAIIGIGALIAYFLGNLIVLFVSRVREYYADAGSVELGNQPNYLASALYKLVYGSAMISKEDLKQVEGVKAFFANDISDARNEIDDLRSMDLDKDGTISESELAQIKYTKTRVKTADKIMEIFSTHPNMVKRIKRLSELS
ncbi:MULTISPECIES: M48 family metalloprotease [Methanobacterium]|jgi:heat shock protein HtpX|uniref:Protease HtpX homolog n=1 Tax=Methanobacterium veterum TaxID=408577 RepID=A0A9E5DKG7_9EURY|nr:MULTISPECIES: M48 family metalloprotease [Methanobacterium]MCZ3364755.1 M48 family metalloprotease [Methanobacterium veterum]MCZ3372509.1 M48 family metalloprotease [Methanobacterium veterum]